MDDSEILLKVKKGMGITTNYQDDTIQIYIDDVKEFMLDAGVLPAVVNHKVSVGCIVRGVIDSWTYTSGGAKYSDAFNKRVIQLTKKTEDDLATTN